MNELVVIGMGWLAAAMGAILLPSRQLARIGSLGGVLPWRNRLVTACIVLSFLFATLGLFPDPIVRASHQYFFVITLGYGHLIGGATFARRRIAAMLPDGVPRRPFGALVAVTVAVLFVLYGSAVAASPGFFFLMLSISTWHIFENDLGLERAYRDRMRLGPIPRSADHHWIALSLTTLVAAVSWATIPSAALGPTVRGSLLEGLTNGPGRMVAASIGAILLTRHGLRPIGGLGFGMMVTAWLLPNRIESSSWFGFSEVFSAVTLYHLVSWLVFFHDRHRQVVSEAGQGPGLMRRIAWVHLVPALLCTAIYAARSPTVSGLEFWVLSPAVYLFWSVLHVFQTAAVRGLEGPLPMAEPARGHS